MNSCVVRALSIYDSITAAASHVAYYIGLHVHRITALTSVLRIKIEIYDKLSTSLIDFAESSQN